MNKFIDYLYSNFYDYLNTPLCNQLINLLIYSWDNNCDFFKKIPNDKDKIEVIHSYYKNELNKKEYKINKNTKVKVTKVNLNDVKSQKLCNNCIFIDNYDQYMFSEIYNEILNINFKKEFDLIEDKLNSIIQKVKIEYNLKIINSIFLDYQTEILECLSELEHFLENEKINFLFNYKEYIIKKELKKDEINSYFSFKKSKFLRVLKLNKKNIYYKIKIIQLLEKKIFELKYFNSDFILDEFLNFCFELSESNLVIILLQYINDKKKNFLKKKISSGCFKIINEQIKNNNKSNKIINYLNDEYEYENNNKYEKCLDICCEKCKKKYFNNIINSS